MRFFFSSTVIALTTASLVVHYAHSAPIVDSSSSKAVAGKRELTVPSRYSPVPRRRSQDDDSNVNTTLSLQDQLTTVQNLLQHTLSNEIGESNNLLQQTVGNFAILGAGQDQSTPFDISANANDFMNVGIHRMATGFFQAQTTVALLNNTIITLQQSFANLGFVVSDSGNGGGNDGQNDNNDDNGNDSQNDGDDDNDN